MPRALPEALLHFIPGLKPGAIHKMNFLYQQRFAIHIKKRFSPSRYNASFNMRHLSLLIGLFFTWHIQCFSQDSVKNERSLFLHGVQLEKPDYNFTWSFKIDDIPKEKFTRYQVNKKGMSARTHITFDSIFFNGFLFRKVIVKVTKKKKDDAYNMREFIGIVDFETLDKMTSFFSYNGQGWIFYSKENYLYRFRLFRHKTEGGIVIDRQ